MERKAIARIATGIVVSYLSSAKQAPVSDTTLLIGGVCDALHALGAPPVPAPASPEPAVAVQESATADAIICLICGKKLITLRRHLGEKHRLLPAQYRWRFNLPEDYPMEAPAYAKLRSDHAKASGFGRTVA